MVYLVKRLKGLLYREKVKVGEGGKSKNGGECKSGGGL